MPLAVTCLNIIFPDKSAGRVAAVGIIRLRISHLECLRENDLSVSVVERDGDGVRPTELRRNQILIVFILVKEMEKETLFAGVGFSGKFVDGVNFRIADIVVLHRPFVNIPVVLKAALIGQRHGGLETEGLPQTLFAITINGFHLEIVGGIVRQVAQIDGFVGRGSFVRPTGFAVFFVLPDISRDGGFCSGGRPAQCGRDIG